MKIIRVLIYEGTEEKLKADLQRRSVKGSRVVHSVMEGAPPLATIIERFEGNALGGDTDVRRWLDEAGPSHDARVGVAALREGPYAITCTYCNASPGFPCVDPKGRAVAVHGARDVDTAVANTTSGNDEALGSARTFKGRYYAACPICGAQAGELCYALAGETTVGAVDAHQGARMNAAVVARAKVLGL